MKILFTLMMLLLSLTLARSFGGQEPSTTKTTYYVALLSRGPKWTPVNTSEGEQIQKAHIANIRKLTEAGQLVLAGPFSDVGKLQGIFIFKVNSLKEAELLVQEDPAVRAERFTAEVHPWIGPMRIGTEQTAVESSQPHVLRRPDEIKWSPGLASLPPGAQVALLSGDPTKPGSPFSIRAKFPDGYKIPPHWHPIDENIIVIQGTLMSALGDKFDQAAGHELVAGSYGLMPKGVRHFSWAKGETIVQMYGIGPFEMNYVNPADDPRKK